ncbi:hypothetical protein DL95DRAFT_109917 [Leptodontidium sp. 2 PMI_412]|nr:hypothetical protein DL95DRAFT_109917 [Leptodontidium sp. 2 PMI_412]
MGFFHRHSQERKKDRVTGWWVPKMCAFSRIGLACSYIDFCFLHVFVFKPGFELTLAVVFGCAGLSTSDIILCLAVCFSDFLFVFCWRAGQGKLSRVDNLSGKHMCAMRRGCVCAKLV